MITDDQLEFVPRAGLWSLGHVACHIASAEEGWFRYAVLREYDKWPQFPHTDYPTVESIKTFLESVHDRTNAYLETIDADDLDRQLSLALGFDASLRYVIWHVLEHEIHHRGEIFLMLGLQGMEAPDV
jgi:uncharacterized damage-inducible protein DinB|tara:strand:- start:288 stop:671 length:384 start_codon:yes stop_codon:yes gene_type:complete